MLSRLCAQSLLLPAAPALVPVLRGVCLIWVLITYRAPPPPPSKPRPAVALRRRARVCVPGSGGRPPFDWSQ